MMLRPVLMAFVAIAFVTVVTVRSDGDPTGSSTSFAASDATWADLNCSGDVTASDPLQALLELGGLPGETAEFCPLFGTPVEADGVGRVFGDINCDGSADGRDAVELIADLAGIGASTGACPSVGAAVNITVLASIVEAGDDWLDYGDAPEGGPTLYTGGAAIGGFPTSAATGPSHAPPFPFRLGEFETAEEAPREDDSADDGLLWLDMDECATSSALVAISLGGLSEAERDTPLTVNIFADWNRDGDWADADGCTDEWALKNFALDVSGEPDFTILTVDFPGGDQVAEFWMRIMLTSADYDPDTGGTLPGETEDYLITGGQVFQPGDSAQPSVLAQPLGGTGSGTNFLCKGGVVPHGSKKVVFDLEQTIASFDSGFRVRRIKTTIPQPTTEDGKKAAGVTSGRTTLDLKKLDKNGEEAKNQLAAGRIRLRITVKITTEKDAPDRLEGPFILDISLSGWQQDGTNIKGSHECAFYVDHSDAADAQVPGLDGFRGGPGHAAPIGKDDPKFIFLQHGRGLTLLTDAMITRAENRGSRYDKTSLTVFGNDGKAIAPADLKTKAGIKSIKVASSGRGIKIKTVKDDQKPPVQRIVIRLKGKAPDGSTFWDYYRVVIVHERGKKAKKLVTDFMESGVAYNFTEEGEAQEVAYNGDGGALLLLEAPSGDILFDDVTTICLAGDGQTVRHPFHSSFGGSSYGFILDYGGGPSSDVYHIPPSNLVARSVSGEDQFCPPLFPVNVTNFGQFSPFSILEATACGDKIIFSEFDAEFGEFQLGAAGFDGSGLGFVPGGQNYRDPSCFTYDHQTGIVGSTPGEDGTILGGYVPLAECNETCTQSVPAPKVIIPADAPNVHILGLAVSPDAMKIAWYRSAPGESQVWIGDFDPFTQTVSNQTQLTTEGLNSDPTWSHDGSQIAFVSDRDGNSEIYVMYADGSDQTNITNTPGADETEPSWQVP